MDVYRKPTKRVRHLSNGKVESPYVARCEDGYTRRIYEHWKAIKKHGSIDSKKWEIPLVMLIKGRVIPVGSVTARVYTISGKEYTLCPKGNVNPAVS